MSVKPCQGEWSTPGVRAEVQRGICNLCQGSDGFHSHLLRGNSPCVTKQGAWEAIKCEISLPSPPSPVAYTMNAVVLFFTNGHCLCTINDYKRGFKHLLKTFYVAGFLIKAQAFKPYKILPCQVLLVLLFCRWRNLEFERLINKPQIWQLRKGSTKTQTMICPTANIGFFYDLWFYRSDSFLKKDRRKNPAGHSNGFWKRDET